MKIDTSRFGEIEVNEAEIVVMRGAILGFDRLRRFVLLQYGDNKPLWWLQSVDDPSIAFVVANPLVVKPDYAPSLSGSALEFLAIEDDADAALLAIVTVRPNPLSVTANLRAPILINVRTKEACQVVLEDPAYPIRYEVTESTPDPVRHDDQK